MASKKALTLVTSKALDENLARKFEEARNRGIKVEDFVKDFLGNFLSEDTRRAYMGDLDAFFNFLRSGGENLTHPKDLHAYHFQLYRDHLVSQGKASATINRRLVAVRSFIKWALSAKLVDHNPLDVVKLPKVQTESPTQAFDDEEVVRMIDAPKADTLKGELHRVALALLFHLGLRRSELTQLKCRDFYKERGHIVVRIHGKGDKVRLVPVAPVVIQALTRYHSFLGSEGVVLDGDDYVLQTDPIKRRGQRMDGSSVYRLVDKYARELGINKKVSPHSCRATVISHLLDTQSTPIRDVAIFAGHANVTTTERYDKRRKNLDKSAAYDVDFDSIKKAQ
ncbi:MAG: tyrosine-type recombinase/integrase [Bacteriovoracaceae bacterium]|nr:tyrosine-type recombinase/integrase [Bacteriovoracaceae bacterium]